MPHELPQEIPALRRHWQAHAPAGDLASRIVAHATALPQHRPWHRKLAEVTRAFSEWNAAIAYQGAALAACAIVGIYTAQAMGNLDDNIDINKLVIADNGWTEGL